ncbi:MAG: ribokinase [Actinobacteria bacterium]|uniref:Unannotated protein n=1 Tax=freshwater metagenome TaxID=449393 RepID=A0A6J6PQY4_9ZZZZ|nr:ribokinase [Actinomycetota bacterium]
MTSPGPGPGEVVVIGSLNLDLGVKVARFPVPGETVAGTELVESPGGKGANQAAAAARLGARVRLIGAVGDDGAGTTLLGAASAAGVDPSGVLRVPEPTGRALIETDPDGENRIVVVAGANATVSPEHARAALDPHDVVVLSLEIPLQAVVEAARHARARGARVVLNPSPLVDLPAELLGCVDVLVLNAHEAGALGLLRDGELSPDAVRVTGVGAVVVTIGSGGAIVAQVRAGSGDLLVDRVEGRTVQVVDTTGCGDAFTGALAGGLAGGRDLVEAVEHANAVGAYAATVRGAQTSYPSRDELEAWLR